MSKLSSSGQSIIYPFFICHSELLWSSMQYRVWVNPYSYIRSNAYLTRTYMLTLLHIHRVHKKARNDKFSQTRKKGNYRISFKFRTSPAFRPRPRSLSNLSQTSQSRTYIVIAMHPNCNHSQSNHSPTVTRWRKRQSFDRQSDRRYLLKRGVQIP